jgi:hypothetical protein
LELRSVSAGGVYKENGAMHVPISRIRALFGSLELVAATPRKRLALPLSERRTKAEREKSIRRAAVGSMCAPLATPLSFLP